MKLKITLALAMLLALCAPRAGAQLPKVYDDSVDPQAQIDQAIAQAAAEGKTVVCQVGGNWCRWCLILADAVAADPEIAAKIADKFVWIHVCYPSDPDSPEGRALIDRLGSPRRFGFPALVMFDGQGNRIHIQDTALLEEGDNGYSRDKLLRVLNTWAPGADAKR